MPDGTQGTNYKLLKNLVDLWGDFQNTMPQELMMIWEGISLTSATNMKHVYATITEETNANA